MGEGDEEKVEVVEKLDTLHVLKSRRVRLFFLIKNTTITISITICKLKSKKIA